jgi:hypothetical protein
VCNLESEWSACAEKYNSNREEANNINIPDFDSKLPEANYSEYGSLGPFTACAWYAEKLMCDPNSPTYNSTVQAGCESSCCMTGLATKVTKLGIVGPERELLIKLFQRAANGEHTVLHELLSKK